MGDSDQVSLIWSQAINHYQAITNKKLEDSTLKSVATVEGLVKVIDDENNNFVTFRAKRQDLIAVLKYAMIPVELVGKIVASGAGQVFWPSALVFSGVRLLLEAAKGVSSRYDAIIELMSSLKDFTSRLEIYAQCQISQHLSQKLAEILASLIEVIAFAQREIKHGRLISFGKNILSGNDASSIATAKFIKLIQSETALVGAETLIQTRETSFAISRMDQNVIKLSQQLEDMGKPRKNATAASTATELKRRLQSGTSAEDQFSVMNRSRIPDTGNWIRQNKEFTSWIEGKIPFLWVSGNPGAGKSYIACSIVNYLQESITVMMANDASYIFSTGYFFFKDDNPETRSIHQSLRDIASQIAQNNSAYAEYLEHCIGPSVDISTLSISSLWQRLFISFLSDPRHKNERFYILFDALDEAAVDDRQELFELAKDVNTAHIQLILLGRPQIAEEMSELVELLDAPTIHISEANNLQDIVQYTTTRLSRSMYLKKLPVDVRNEIINRLSSDAQGMVCQTLKSFATFEANEHNTLVQFLWAALMFQELLRQRSVSGVQKALSTAPKGLSSMIQHVLRGISESLREDPQYADELNELLAWVLCAKRPLSLGEIANILKWKSPDGEGWIWLEGSLRIQFASIFSVNREDGMTTADLSKSTRGESTSANMDLSTTVPLEESSQLSTEYDSHPRSTTVTFNHAYWGDFFRGEVSKISASDEAPSIGVVHQDAHILLLKRCLEFFCDDSFPLEQPIDITLLQRYARESLTFHLEALDINKITIKDKQDITSQLARLLMDEKPIKKFLPLLQPQFFSEETVDLLIKWLGDPGDLENIPESLRTKLNGLLSHNRVNILFPVAQHLATVWLSNKNIWFGGSICTSLCNFIALQNLHSPPRTISLEQIMEAAEWANCHKDALWYENVGKTLQERSFFSAAIENFQKTLELDPSSNRARSNLALTHALTGDLQAAIDLEIASANYYTTQGLSSENLRHLHGTYERLASYYQRLQNWPNCIIVAKKGHETATQCTRCANLLLCAYSESKQRDEGFSFLQHLNKIHRDTNDTSLVELLIRWPSIYNMLKFGTGAMMANKYPTSFFIRAYSQALMSRSYKLSSQVTVSLQLCLAYIHRVYAYETDRAEEICLQVVRDYRNSPAEGPISCLVDKAFHNLSSHYLSKYLRSDRTESDTQNYSKILEDLSRGRLPDDGLDNTNRIGPLSKSLKLEIDLILGQFYEICGQKAKSSTMLKTNLKNCLTAMENRFPEMDWYEFSSLAKILSAIGDDEYYAAAMYQCEVFASLERDSYLSPQICDGCGSSCDIDGFSICSYCDDTGVCEDCLLQLKSGTLPINVCHQEHHLSLIPPRPLHVKSRSPENENMLYVGGEWLAVDVFKARLEAKYEL